MDPSGPFDVDEPKFFPDKYKKRSDWRATYADSRDLGFQFGNNVVLTFTGTDPCLDEDACKKAVKEIQLRDKDSGFPDIRYSFVIGGDGFVYEGRSWIESPEVPEKHKDDKDFTLNIAYIGHFGETPSEEQVKAYKDLVAVGNENYLIAHKAKFFEYLTESPSYSIN